MKAAPGAGHREFLALLREQPGDWNRAKALAFEELVAAFPDPEGPPAWALRQIERGQFDKRIPPAWRPVFVEVFHQWLGFHAESEAASESVPSSPAWWTRSFVPGLRRHGWAGAALSPLAALLVALLLAWSCLAEAREIRAAAARRGDEALLRLHAIANERIDPADLSVLESLRDGSDESLLDVLARGPELGRARAMLVEERDRALSELAEAREQAATWWAWPLVSRR